MKVFFTYLYKTCLWVLAFFGLVGLLIAFGFYVLVKNLDEFVAASASVSEPMPERIVLHLDMDGSVESAPVSGLDEVFGGGMQLHDIIDVLEYAATDDSVESLLLTFGSLEIGLADAEELRAALLEFKDSGKPIMAWSDSFGEFSNGTTPYYLATSADEIWMQPMGMVAFNGLSAQIPFARDLLTSIGITPEVIRRENYKTMMDSLSYSEITPENREMMTAILTDINDQLISDVAPSRGLAVEDMRFLMANMPATDEMAIERGLIDRLAWRDEIDDFMEDGGAEIYDISLYADNMVVEDIETTDKPKSEQFALIYAMGNIGRSDMPNMMPIDGIIEGLEDAVEDDAITAIILRVDSGGGSVIGSERLRRAVSLAAEAKPLIVTMGNLAGSGGYWISVDADAIVAEPATLTGSIGVIAGKIDASELSANLGVNWESISEFDNNQLLSPFSSWNEDEYKLLDEHIGLIYNGFLVRVSEARGLTMEETREVAQGRVWTGRQALELGLVDALGGLDRAVEAGLEEAGLAKDVEVELIIYPAPQSFMEEMQMAFSSVGMQQENYARLGNMLEIMDNFGVFEDDAVNGGQVRMGVERRIGE